jgi:hypothetical protein
MKVADILN